MAAISYSIKRGAEGTKITDFTHGVLAPNADDIEVRINTTDLNAAALQVKDIVKALEAFARAVESDAIYGTDWGV